MCADRPEKFVTNLDWNLLRTFVVISEEGSITAAANRLLLRQPTVSLALQRLEAQLETRLIDRGHGVFRLTAVGLELFRECVDIYSSVSRLNDVADSASREVSGNIHISLASHVTTPLLDNVLSAFHAEHPKVTYKLNTESSALVARNLLDKTSSLGICLVNKRLPELEYEVMYREFFSFFCGPPHPLFGKKNLKINDLSGHAAVSFETDDIADALRPVALLRHQFELGQQIIGLSPHLEEVRRMILCGIGIGPLPNHVVERDVRDGLLWRLPPYINPPAIDIFLVTNPRKRYNKAEALFIQALKAKIASTPMADRTYKGDGKN